MFAHVYSPMSIRAQGHRALAQVKTGKAQVQEGQKHIFKTCNTKDPDLYLARYVRQNAPDTPPETRMPHLTEPQIQAFFDEATNTITYLLRDPGSNACAVIDSVLDFDYASGRTDTRSADAVIPGHQGSGP